MSTMFTDEEKLPAAYQVVPEQPAGDQPKALQICEPREP